MTLFSGITLVTPVLRINNRERNTEFYRKNLGFKVLKEENSQVFFGGHQEKLVRFSIEESPSMRVRAVEGPKKLASVIIKAEDPKEIESLLASVVFPSRTFLRGKRDMLMKFCHQKMMSFFSMLKMIGPDWKRYQERG